VASSILLALAAVVFVAVLSTQAQNPAPAPIPNLKPFHDASGYLSTFTPAGSIDTTNPFFQDLGTNGRRCVTCHQPSDAWSVTPPHIQKRFQSTSGLDPIFRPIDGATCPTDDVSTLAARQLAYALLLAKGLIRIEIPVPAGAEFTVLGVDNRYGCLDTTKISLYRRPLPATGLAFNGDVMWDERETVAGQAIGLDLDQQAIDATMIHAQATNPPTTAQVQQIVSFETALYTAQITDTAAGSLTAQGALGGPVNLSQQNFFLGINDPLGGNPTGARFTPVIFTTYQSWTGNQSTALQSVANGEAIFNGGFCGVCHDTPGVGGHSLPLSFNIGTSEFGQRTPDLPLITLKNSTTGEIKRTSDPGRALISGKWSDLNTFKVPSLRGLSGRAPYFHNGSAATLRDVVEFYQKKFNLGLTPQQKNDLVNFLSTL
jgi:cytochrome c peroxidase